MQISTSREIAYPALLETLRAMLAKNPEGVSLGLLIMSVGDLGDDMLDQLETRLQATLRQHDVLIRLSQEKFAALMGNLRNQAHLSLAANKLLRIAESTTRSTPRIGMALATGPAADADSLLQAANAALQTAEEEHEPCKISDTVMSLTLGSRWATRTELEEALSNNRLDVHYEPKVSSKDYAIVGAEALTRWFRDRDAPVPPEVFLPLADRCGLIDKLTWHALTVAARQTAAWTREFGTFAIAVNVTPNVIEHHDLPNLAGNAIGLCNIAPEQLTIEITESALMQNPAQSNAVLKDLRSAGINVAIDNFGTGYSSLAYFKNIPANELKIDKSFVINLLNDPGDRQVVQSIIGLARGFGLSVTAEGVANAETAALLAEMGCDFLQGRHFSKPVPAESIYELLAGQRHSQSETALPANR